FVEPHMHLWSTVLADSWLNCSAIENPTFNDVVAKLKAEAANTAAGDWIQGQLFDPSLYPGEPELTRAILDQVSTEHPVGVLNASMHYLYVNSKALELAGVTEETPDPPGGFFGKTDGKLNGIVGESGAILKFMAVIPQRSQAQLAAGLIDIMNKAASVGVTSMREGLTGAVMGPGEFSLLTQLNAANRLPVRISTAQHGLLGNDAWASAGVTPGAGDDMVRAVAWKVLSDGSNQGRSGYMRDAYIGQPDNRGHANMDIEKCIALIKEGHDAGWQVMTHANGDAAIDMVVSAYEQALGDAADVGDHRHRIEHCSLATAEHFERMARIGVHPSFLMNHVYYWGRVFRDHIIGAERANELDGVASALAAGLRPSLHSDYSVSPMQPLLSARTAVERKLRDGGDVLNEAECVSPEAALRAVTSGAAWQVHGDDRGTLEVGKKADYALLSANPWEADPSTWADITVHETRIDGTVAWSS
ncbi:MAG: amidohydrolase, partial [Candidatus Nanopelagicales bacterium]